MFTSLVPTQIVSAPRPLLSGGTRRTYQRAWSSFERWTTGQGMSALPASPDAITTYLKHLAERDIRINTVKVAYAAIADAHLRSGCHDAAVDPLVKIVLTDLVSKEKRPPQPPIPLTAQALDAIRDAACTPREFCGRIPHMEPTADAISRGLVDVTIISVMRDAQLRRSEAAALRWKDVTLMPDGSGRLFITGARDQESIAYVGIDAVAHLLAIQPGDVTNEDARPIFGLSPGHIGKRVRESARAAGLGDGYTGDSCRAGMALDMRGSRAPARKTKPPLGRFKDHSAAGRGPVARYYQRLMMQTRDQPLLSLT